MLKVTYFFREYRPSGFSIEGIFNVVKSVLHNKIQIGEYHLDPKKSRLSNILTVRKLPEGINHITGDVYFLALGFKGDKNILTIHDLGHYENLKKHPLKFFIYHYFWLYFPVKKATIITVVSEFTKEKLIKAFGVPDEKIRVIYNPVKPIFRQDEKKSLNPVPRILQIGSGAHKNLSHLIEACKGLNVHLDIVAWLDEQQIQKLKVNKISYTVYSGLSEEEVYQRYKECDILFFASFIEGFGMPITEAQYVGRPVITSGFGAMKEIAGDSAVLVDPYKPEEIRTAIQKLLSDRHHYNDIVSRGRENVKKFHHEKIANDYLDLYKELSGV